MKRERAAVQVDQVRSGLASMKGRNRSGTIETRIDDRRRVEHDREKDADGVAVSRTKAVSVAAMQPIPKVRRT